MEPGMQGPELTENEKGAIDYEIQCELEAIEQALSSGIRIPDGYERIPTPKISRSCIYDFGVRIRKIPGYKTCKSSERVYRVAPKTAYICLASDRCRQRAKQGGIMWAIATGMGRSTSQALGHLTNMHSRLPGIQSVKANSIIHGLDKGSPIRSSVYYDDEFPQLAKKRKLASYDRNTRSGALQYALFAIKNLMGFSLLERPSIQKFFETNAPGIPSTSLTAKRVKHHVVEYHSAWKNHVLSRLKRDFGSQMVCWRGSGYLTCNFDFWTSCTSNQKCIGLRIWWISKLWNVETALLAMRPFNPKAELQMNELLDELFQWANVVLQDFDLKWKDVVFGVIFDGWNIFKREHDLLMDTGVLKKEWSVPHMLAVVIAEVLGVAEDRRMDRSFELEAVFTKVGKTMENCKAFTNMDMLSVGCTDLFGEISMRKLKQGYPQSVIEICLNLHYLLSNWNTLESLCKKHSRAFPVAEHRAELQQLFSIMQPVADIISNAQETRAISGPRALLELVALRLVVLDSMSKLPIMSPCEGTGVPGQQHIKGTMGAVALSHISLPHDRLSPLVQDIRQRAAAALDSHFFIPRYDMSSSMSDPPSVSSYLFDLALLLYPEHRDGWWLDDLAISRADDLKALLWSTLQSLTEAVLEPQAEMAVGGSSKMGFASVSSHSGDSSEPKTCSSGLRDSSPLISLLQSRRHMPCRDMPLRASIGKEAEKSVSEKASSEIHKYIKYVLPLSEAHLNMSDICYFWKNVGAVEFPHLAIVASIVLAAPASSAVQERDFSMASQLLQCLKHTSPEYPYVEMCMTMSGEVEDVLDTLNVPEIDVAAIHRHIPTRFTDSTKVCKLTHLEDAGGRIIFDTSVENVAHVCPSV